MDLGGRSLAGVEKKKDREVPGLKMATGTKYPQIRGYPTRWAWIRVVFCARGYGHGYDFKPDRYSIMGLEI